MNTARHSLAIVEDEKQLLESFLKMVSGSGTWDVAGTYPNAEAALDAIPASPPDLMIVDIQLPGMSGIELVKKLAPLCPKTQFLMVTVFEDASRVFNALAAGASGYVLKRDVYERLLDSMNEVLAGGAPMSSAIARKVVKHFQIPVESPVEDLHLTQREKEVLDLLVKGLFYKEIASDLGIRVDTVSCHLGNIYRKLHVRSRTEAVLKYSSMISAADPSAARIIPDFKS